MMFMVLWSSNTPRLARFTGLFAGMLVFLYITFEAPYSGMSINPARTVASALPSGIWTASWLYFAAPIFGMFLAAETYSATVGLNQVTCAKLNHQTDRRCIFCGFTGKK
jgi:aquaporin Z